MERNQKKAAKLAKKKAQNKERQKRFCAKQKEQDGGEAGRKICAKMRRDLEEAEAEKKLCAKKEAKRKDKAAKNEAKRKQRTAYMLSPNSQYDGNYCILSLMAKVEVLGQMCFNMKECSNDKVACVCNLASSHRYPLPYAISIAGQSIRDLSVCR